MTLTKFLLRALLTVLFLAGLIIAFYLLKQQSRQKTVSRADSVCTASITIKPTSGNLTVGQQFNVQILADMDGKNLFSSVVTIAYETSKIEIIGGERQQDGSVKLTDYQKDDGLSDELSTIVVFPDMGKIYILASCRINQANRCDRMINGNSILLATVPLKAKAGSTGGTALAIQHTGCNDPDSLSAIVKETESPDLNKSILGSIHSAQYRLVESAVEPTVTPTPSITPTRGVIHPSPTETIWQTQGSTPTPSGQTNQSLDPTSIPTISPTPIVEISVEKGDINNDGILNLSDFALMLSSYGSSGEYQPSDVNNDKRVDALDLSLFFNLLRYNYGKSAL